MQQSRILIDTNIFLSAAERIPIFAELHTHYPQHSLWIVEGVRDELERLMKPSATKEGRQARLALALLDKQDLNTAPQSAGYVDAALLAEAQREPAAILTMDRELQKRALASGIPVLTVRGRRSIVPVHS